MAGSWLKQLSWVSSADCWDLNQEYLKPLAPLLCFSKCHHVLRAARTLEPQNAVCPGRILQLRPGRSSRGLHGQAMLLGIDNICKGWSKIYKIV